MKLDFWFDFETVPLLFKYFLGLSHIPLSYMQIIMDTASYPTVLKMEKALYS